MAGAAQQRQPGGEQGDEPPCPGEEMLDGAMRRDSEQRQRSTTWWRKAPIAAELVGTA